MKWQLPDFVYVIGEIGGNHVGSLQTALRIVDMAVDAKADAVKFQMRSPRECVPLDQWNNPYSTPWGVMSYIEYRERMEFSFDDYIHINNYCQANDIEWSASVWDISSLEKLMRFDPPWIKVPSAMLTDETLLKEIASTCKPVIYSTGMSTMEEIRCADSLFGSSDTLIAHCTSTYPCPKEELNLNMIKTLRHEFPHRTIGYSGHEVGLATTVASVALGAQFVERHITLDRTMWGSDQAASVESQGLKKLVSDIRAVEQSLGDGIKQVYDSELAGMQKLRKNITGGGFVNACNSNGG